MIHPDEPQLRGDARWFEGVPVIPSPSIGVPAGYEMCFFTDAAKLPGSMFMDNRGYWVLFTGEIATGIRAWCRPVPQPMQKPSYGNIRALVYASVLPGLQEVAHRCGYALAIHGTMTRDFDIIAVPWTVEAVPAVDLIERIRVLVSATDGTAHVHGPGVHPHGRQAWTITLGCGYYLDISVPRSLAVLSETELVSRIRQLESAVYWALGQNGDFKLRGEKEGAYWWRKELRQRSHVPDKVGDDDEVTP
jgi:hypothetical protein